MISLLLVIFILSLVFGIVGLILKLTGKLVSGILKIIFQPSLLLIAVLVVAYIYFVM